MHLIQSINRKYPFAISNLKNTLFIGILISAILFIFQPFGFYSYEKSKIVASLGFGLVTIFSLFLCNYLVKKPMLLLLKKWTILTEFIYTLFVLISISFLNLCYLSVITEAIDISIKTFSSTLIITGCIGIFPISGMIMIRYNQTLKNNLNKLIQEGRPIDSQEINNQLTFNNLNKTELEFSIAENDFLFLEALKNHIHIYYLDQGDVKTKNIRNTLNNIDDQICNQNLFRCHRSFIVNLNEIKTAKGNSNGYKIYLNHCEQIIPVSRKYTPNFQQLIY